MSQLSPAWAPSRVSSSKSRRSSCSGTPHSTVVVVTQLVVLGPCAPRHHRRPRSRRCPTAPRSVPGAWVAAPHRRQQRPVSTPSPSPSRSARAGLRPDMARIREVSGPRDLGAVAVGPVHVGGPQAEPGDPSLGAEQQVGLHVIVGDGGQRVGRHLVGDAERPSDVLAVDDDLPEHHHDGGGRVVRRRRPGPEPTDQFCRRHLGQSPGGPVGEHVEAEARQDELLVEVRHRLLGGGQDVAGGDVDRPAVAPRRGRPLLGPEASQQSATAARSAWMRFQVSVVFTVGSSAGRGSGMRVGAGSREGRGGCRLSP